MYKGDIKNPDGEHIAHPARAEIAMSRNAESLQGGNSYYQWNLDVFPIERGRRILDLGCGPGMYFKPIMTYAPELYSANYLKQIELLGHGNANCKTCLLDLLSHSLPEPLVGQRFDYAFCFDVLEHIKEDEKALRNIHRIMTVTGTEWLFLRVPALQFIYGTNDEAIGHFRRYSADSLTSLLQRCSFRIRRMRYHNILGIVPWYVIGRLVGRSLAVSANEGKMFNSIVPLLRFAERILPPPIGLSLYCICRPAR
jgi:SAM-dependent methyltransferase